MSANKFPRKTQFLFESAPYKVLYGGRGAGKSWGMARALVALGATRKLFIVCGREIQRSIKESVHRLLGEQIALLGLGAFYEIKETEIIGSNGTKFAFVGVRNNVAALKSIEGIDICWITEATFVSKNSWEVLLPTVRRDPPYGPFGQGSEIWIDFNPSMQSDETYQRWVVNPPKGAIAVEQNWDGNPWFPTILRQQMLEMKERDPDAWLNIWQGKPARALAGAIYERELQEAIVEGRISTSVKPLAAKGVIVSVDLGRADMTSIWFWQQVGLEHHAIDFFEDCGHGWDFYLRVIQERGYPIAGVWLPHDAAHEQLAANKTIAAQTRDAFPTNGIVRVVPRVANVALRINAVRTLFPRIYINEQTCSQGILSLQHYRYDVSEEGQRSQKPLHDQHSHAADAFGTYAQALREGFHRDALMSRFVKKSSYPSRELIPYRGPPGTGWMST
jgi:phage terminase large subunit